jgi:molybdenum cofactor biosynthesis enzyme
MPAPTFVYSFEGISSDLPRPPMAALRALLSAGVLVSARGWQEVSPEARGLLAAAGAADVIDDARVAELMKLVPVSHVKFVGKRSEPDALTVPPDLAAALGPMRPLTVGEWRGLRPLDRYVLSSLVKNSRLLAKALNEMLPQAGGAVTPEGVVIAWSGLVARCELRMRREVAQKAMTGDFMGGRAFVLASVAGRRAARRASDLLDQQADSTVGPIEIDWGLRENDDVLYWQAHVSAWDGTFFPAAAMLAASSAAVAMYDMIRPLDQHACLIFAGVREEPWQVGRDRVQEPATSLFNKVTLSVPPGATQAEDLRETAQRDFAEALRDSTPRLHETLRMANAPSSGLGSLPPSPRVGPISVPTAPASQPDAAAARTPSSGRAAPSAVPTRKPPPRAAWVGVAVVGLVVLANLVVLLGILVLLSRSHH